MKFLYYIQEGGFRHWDNVDLMFLSMVPDSNYLNSLFEGISFKSYKIRRQQTELTSCLVFMGQSNLWYSGSFNASKQGGGIKLALDWTAGCWESSGLLPLVADWFMGWHHKWEGKAESKITTEYNILGEWYFLALYFCRTIFLIID